MNDEYYYKLYEAEIKELLMHILKENPRKFKNGNFNIVDIELHYDIRKVEVFAVLKLQKGE